jgi:hypothetical protein
MERRRSPAQSQCEWLETSSRFGHYLWRKLLLLVARSNYAARAILNARGDEQGVARKFHLRALATKSKPASCSGGFRISGDPGSVLGRANRVVL